MNEFQNPQNDPGSEKRMLLAFFLVFLVIAAMQFLLPKPQPPANQQPSNQAQQGQPQQPPPAPAVPSTASTTPTRPKGPAAAAQVPVKVANGESETVFEDEDSRVTFTNRGGTVKSWVLKKFTDNKGSPLDMVNPALAAQLGRPLSLYTFRPDLDKKINEAFYVASATGPANSVTFEYSDGDSSVRKTFIKGQSYQIHVETEVTDHGQRVQAHPQWPSGLGDQVLPGAFAASKIDWMQNGSVERKSPQSGWFLTGKKWVIGGQSINGPFNWAAVADQYFAVAFMPDSPSNTALVTLHEQVEVPRDPNKPNDAKDKVPVLGVALGNTNGVTRERVLVGPKAVDVLDSTEAQPGGPDLRGIYDFGTFGFIARPLFLWLKWTFQHWIHNWGWAIAFLTVVITLALTPLRISSMKSSLRMQRIQPQVKAITEKYKRYSITDPRRAEMQKEMSALYKKEGVNPIGGCFPLLLQMPFLFAFYSMLGNAIELRHANWLWISDLSGPDPLHILPILIIISMFLTQRSTPQAGMDPAQQKIMNIMAPLMIGGISWNVAAGLSIYWALSTLLTYAQQVLINRSDLGQQVRKTVERRATRKR